MRRRQRLFAAVIMMLTMSLVACSEDRRTYSFKLYDTNVKRIESKKATMRCNIGLWLLSVG